MGKMRYVSYHFSAHVSLFRGFDWTWSVSVTVLSSFLVALPRWTLELVKATSWLMMEGRELASIGDMSYLAQCIYYIQYIVLNWTVQHAANRVGTAPN